MKPEFLWGKNFILFKVKVEILNYCNIHSVGYPRNSLPDFQVPKNYCTNLSKQAKGSLEECWHSINWTKSQVWTKANMTLLASKNNTPRLAAETNQHICSTFETLNLVITICHITKLPNLVYRNQHRLSHKTSQMPQPRFHPKSPTT